MLSSSCFDQNLVFNVCESPFPWITYHRHCSFPARCKHKWRTSCSGFDIFLRLSCRYLFPSLQRFLKRTTRTDLITAFSEKIPQKRSLILKMQFHITGAQILTDKVVRFPRRIRVIEIGYGVTHKHNLTFLCVLCTFTRRIVAI